MKNNPELLKAVQYFTREKAIMTGLLLVCGTGSRTETAMDGDVREDSVFDLASLTKLFTGLCAMRLKEDYLGALDNLMKSPAWDGEMVDSAWMIENAVLTPEYGPKYIALSSVRLRVMVRRGYGSSVPRRTYG